MKKCTSVIIFVLLLSLSTVNVVVAKYDHQPEEESLSIRLSLARAKQKLIDTVKRGEKGAAKVVEAKLDDIDTAFSFGEQTVVYTLVTMKSEKFTKQIVDPQSGEVIDSKDLLTFSLFGDDYRDIDFALIKITMASAIERVEQDSGAEVYKARFDERDGVWWYVLGAIGNDRFLTYLVDPVSGKFFLSHHYHGEDH